MMKTKIFLLAFLTLFAANSFADYYTIYFANNAVGVTEANSDDLTAALVAAGVNASGTITYDSETNTLTLDDASIEVGNATAILTMSKAITINLIGTNDIVVTGSNFGIYPLAVLTITGEGRLNIESGYAALYPYGSTLVIDNTTVNANGAYYGISGNGSVSVSINNSTVSASGSLGSISSIGSLDLQGCEINQPDGAAFDAAQKAVCVSGVAVTEGVIIQPTTSTAIENIETNAAVFARDGRVFGAENARIYDVLGRDVTHLNGSLHGVYMVKTDKIATKIAVK